MGKIISCCGVVCSECSSYPKECAGCAAIEGRVFWLEYTGGEVCDIYGCCVEKKGLRHCGRCEELPCERYAQKDPTKTDAENEEDFRKQMEQLEKMKNE